MNIGRDSALGTAETCVVNSDIALARLQTLQVFYLDLSLIMDHNQATTPAHIERVQMNCERQINRLAPHELLLFEGNGFFLVIQTRTGEAAQALINQINIALLKHFFGTDSFTPEQLNSFFHVATPAEAQRAAALPALERRLRVIDDQSPDAGARAAAGADISAATMTASVVSPSPPAGIELDFVPVCDLRKDTATTFFCMPTKRNGENLLLEAAALYGLDPRQRPQLDIAMLDRSLSFLREVAEIGIVCGAGTSVSFETLAWSRGRQLYQQALRAAGAASNPFLMIKICDVPPGTPEGRIAEIVTTIRPLTKRLFVQLPVEDLPWHFCGHLGVTGLVAALPVRASPVLTARITHALVRAAVEQRAIASIEGIERTDCIGIVKAAGARFATGGALETLQFATGIELNKFKQDWTFQYRRHDPISAKSANCDE